MTGFADILIGLSLLIGALFTFVGSFGLLKLDMPMKRLHGPTKAGTLGIGALLMAAMIDSFLSGHGTIQHILIMAFLFVTAPISALFIAKVHIHTGTCQKPPQPTEDSQWATKAVVDTQET
jgi:multicomponent K+:H+ antiporter subunit G